MKPIKNFFFRSDESIDLVKTFTDYTEEWDYTEINPGRKGMCIMFLTQLEEMGKIRSRQVVALSILTALKLYKDTM
jgi:hypothetical protein